MGALLAELQRRGAFDEAFLAAHALGADEVKAVLATVPVAEWLAAADVSAADFEQLLQMVMAARAMVVRVELGIQQGLNSTLNSYLEKLLYPDDRPLRPRRHARAAQLAGAPVGQHAGRAPLRHAGRSHLRAAVSQRLPRCRALGPPGPPACAVGGQQQPGQHAADTARVLQAMRALELVVVVDVAFTETAAQAHYVLPASSTYEKCEFTLFNFEVPTNYFHVRSPVLPPLPGTLPEPEIYGRLARALGLMPSDDVLADLAAKADDPAAFGAAFAAAVALDRNVGKLGGQVLYETLGRSLPDGTAAAAPLLQACHRLAKMQTTAVRAALQADASLPLSALGEALFRKVVGARSGTAFTVHASPWELVEHPDRKLRLAVPRMLEWLGRLDPGSVGPPPTGPSCCRPASGV